MSDAYTPPGRPVDLAQGETWCQGCGAIWRAASRLCHCAACHRTWTGLAGFDAHQVTFCDRCTPDHPCKNGRHDGRYRIACHSGPTSTEIAADASGRYQAQPDRPAPPGSTGAPVAGRGNGA